jgi:branched-chain amino acid aminotransferase
MSKAPQSFQPLPKLWLDGQVIATEQATFHFFTHALHYGVGVFEGVRCYTQENGTPAIFRLKEHIRRLIDSSRMCLMEPPFSQAQLEDACVAVVRESGVDACYLRPLIWLGEGPLGIGSTSNKIRAAVGSFPWGAYMGEEGLAKGIRCCVSSLSRIPQTSNLPKGKICGQYVNSVLAKRAAQLAGYDEALLVDHNGHITEGTGENIFMLRDGILKTPPLSTSILAGITRASVLELARERASQLGITVVETNFGRDELYCADEIFLTGTAAEVTPVREVEGRTIGAGKPGPVTRALMAAYQDVVRGRDASKSQWLTPIPKR